MKPSKIAKIVLYTIGISLVIWNCVDVYLHGTPGTTSDNIWSFLFSIVQLTICIVVALFLGAGIFILIFEAINWVNNLFKKADKEWEEANNRVNEFKNKNNENLQGDYSDRDIFGNANTIDSDNCNGKLHGREQSRQKASGRKTAYYLPYGVKNPSR